VLPKVSLALDNIHCSFPFPLDPEDCCLSAGTLECAATPRLRKSARTTTFPLHLRTEVGPGTKQFIRAIVTSWPAIYVRKRFPTVLIPLLVVLSTTQIAPGRSCAAAPRETQPDTSDAHSAQKGLGSKPHLSISDRPFTLTDNDSIFTLLAD
jgi:hypothetical protein